MGYKFKVANWELGLSGDSGKEEHSPDKLLEQWQISNHNCTITGQA
jgi:hypothetical protein